MYEIIPILVVFLIIILCGAGFHTILFSINEKISAKNKLKDKTLFLISIVAIFSLAWPTFSENGISKNDIIATLIILMFTGMVFDRVFTYFFSDKVDDEDIREEN